MVIQKRDINSDNDMFSSDDSSRGGGEASEAESNCLYNVQSDDQSEEGNEWDPNQSSFD